MMSLVKKNMNNLLAFKMLIHIFTIVSVRWRDVKRVRLFMGKDFGHDNERIENTRFTPTYIYRVNEGLI